MEARVTERKPCPSCGAAWIDHTPECEIAPGKPGPYNTPVEKVGAPAKGSPLSQMAHRALEERGRKKE